MSRSIESPSSPPPLRKPTVSNPSRRSRQERGWSDGYGVGDGAVFRVGGAGQVGSGPLEAAGLRDAGPRHGDQRQLVRAVVGVAGGNGAAGGAAGIRFGDRQQVAEDVAVEGLPLARRIGDGGLVGGVG